MNRQFFGKLFDFAGGLFAGAALWFLSGLFIIWLWSLLPSYYPVSLSSAAFAVFNIVISVFLVRSITKKTGKNYFAIGMLLFIAGGLLLPGPCSIYSLSAVG